MTREIDVGMEQSRELIGMPTIGVIEEMRGPDLSSVVTSEIFEIAGQMIVAEMIEAEAAGMVAVDVTDGGMAAELAATEAGSEAAIAAGSEAGIEVAGGDAKMGETTVGSPIAVAADPDQRKRSLRQRSHGSLIAMPLRIMRKREEKLQKQRKRHAREQTAARRTVPRSLRLRRLRRTVTATVAARLQTHERQQPR